MPPFAAALLMMTPLSDTALQDVRAAPPVQVAAVGAHELRIDLRASGPLALPAISNLVIDAGRHSTVQAQTVLSFSVTIRP